MSILFKVIALIITVTRLKAFYLPGLAPVTYCSDINSSTCKSDVPVYVNRLNSLNTVLPYEYDRFDLCRNEKEEDYLTLNIGQVVFGERIKLSPYKLTFLKDMSCEKMCEKTYSPNNTDSLQKLDFMRKGIELNYLQNWIIDNMPVTWCYLVEDGMQYCSRSLPLGCFVTRDGKKKDSCIMSAKFVKRNTHYFFNHVDLTITYHNGHSEDRGQTNTISGRIISAKVEPRSVAFDENAVGDQMCVHDSPMGIEGGTLEWESTVRYTYSVRWLEDGNTRWSSRWDYILMSMPHTNIMVFSTVNSLLVILFLTGVVVRITTKSFSKSSKESSKKTWCCFDFEIDLMFAVSLSMLLIGKLERYAYDELWNTRSNGEMFLCRPRFVGQSTLICTDGRETVGGTIMTFSKADNQFNWKLIYGDIFRPPSCGMLLAVLNGSGVQVLFTALITLVFACFGMLSPANRGALETCTLISFVCLGFPAGYVSARLYKAFGGEKKLLNALLTATACPGIVFISAMILNLVFWSEGSSAAIPYTTVLALIGLWFGVSLPLSFLGTFFGFRRKTIKQPVKTEPTSRQVPKLKFYLKPLTSFIIGGFLPFGCICIQIFFILNSIWAKQVYYTYGFLSLSCLLLMISCVLVTILLCFFHLCAEDYHWWWRSFLNSSFTSVYFFLYCIHYYVTKLELQGGVSAFLYFGYSLIAAFLLFLLTGTVGFFSCFWFVRKIYGTVKGCDMWSTKG